RYHARPAKSNPGSRWASDGRLLYNRARSGISRSTPVRSQRGASRSTAAGWAPPCEASNPEEDAMALHFKPSDLAARRGRARGRMRVRGLVGLLLFRQESMYYLTGYDTSGYSMFQGMCLGADGSLALCTRSADLRQAKMTSIVDDIRIWRDRAGATPAHD